MDTIGYAGLFAVERMAQVIGEKEDEERFAYLRAKISPATALRFNFPRYFDPQANYPRLYVTGFAEDGPSIEKAQSENNSRGLDHIGMCLTWTGEMPELFHFYFDLMSPEFFTSFQRNFMDKEFANWRQMTGNIGRIAAHIACRALLPDWSQDELKHDYEAYLETDGHRLSPRLASAGMFGAYSGHRDMIYLIDWEPGILGTVTYDPELKKLNIKIKSNDGFSLRLNAPLQISRIMIDGNSVSNPSDQRNGQQHLLRLPKCSDEVVIYFQNDLQGAKQ
jgi:hypothetical protein